MGYGSAVELGVPVETEEEDVVAAGWLVCVTPVVMGSPNARSCGLNGSIVPEPIVGRSIGSRLPESNVVVTCSVAVRAAMLLMFRSSDPARRGQLSG